MPGVALKQQDLIFPVLCFMLQPAVRTAGSLYSTDTPPFAPNANNGLGDGRKCLT
jgi:hypothetical protein